MSTYLVRDLDIVYVWLRCAWCRREFPATPKETAMAVACSQRCRQARRRGQGRPCVVCGAPFRPRDNGARQKYCSPGCRNRSRVGQRPGRWTPVPRAERSCVLCGEPFLVVGRYVHRRQFCTSLCRHRARHRAARAHGEAAQVLRLCPVDFERAAAFVKAHHRHHLPPVGWKFGVGIARGDELVGVVTVGRPVARMLDDGTTLEVTRCCVIEGVKNGASMLYGAAWRAAKALGYSRLVTYTLRSEPGTSLRAAGWTALYETPGRSWNVPSRPRHDKHPLGAKTLWEAAQVARAITAEAFTRMQLRAMSEWAWRAQVIDWARLGCACHREPWRVTAMHDSRKQVWGTDRGVPDLLLAHPHHGVLWLELKREVGKVTEDQQGWIEVLQAGMQRVYVARPSDGPFVRSLLHLERAGEREGN